MSTTKSSFELMKLRLVPAVRAPAGLPGRTLVPEVLDAGLSIRTLHGYEPITEDDLDAWGVDFDTAMAVAMDNLRAQSSKSRVQDVETVPGMQIYLPSGGDAASRSLLLSELLPQFPAEGVLFAIPGPDQLLIVPLVDFGSLEAIRVLVTAAHVASQNTRDPLTDQLFWTDGETFTHIRVEHRDGGIELLAPQAFLHAVERLASMALMPVAAEA